MSDDEKVRENRLRRAALRQDMTLRKSRRRDPRALEYGNYWLVDLRTNFALHGGNWGISLDEVEERLNEGRYAPDPSD